MSCASERREEGFTHPAIDRSRLAHPSSVLAFFLFTDLKPWDGFPPPVFLHFAQMLQPFVTGRVRLMVGTQNNKPRM